MIGTSFNLNMNKIVFLFVCLLSGVLLKETSILKKEDSTVLNKLVIYYFIPLVSLLHLPSIVFSFDLLWLSITPFMVFIFGMIYFGLLDKVVHLGHKSKQALILTCGISSTSFVGFPIFELLYGAEGLAYGVFLSLGGTILVFNTLGIGLLFTYTSKKVSAKDLFHRIIMFFPFLIFLISIAFNLLGIRLGNSVENLLELLVAPFATVALLSVGLQLEFKAIKKFSKEIALGQFYKLILAPILILVILKLVIGLDGIVSNICILGAGIGSMNAMSIMTAENKIQPDLAVLMPAIGIPISFFTLIFMNNILGRL